MLCTAKGTYLKPKLCNRMSEKLRTDCISCPESFRGDLPARRQLIMEGRRGESLLQYAEAICKRLILFIEHAIGQSQCIFWVKANFIKEANRISR